MKGRAMYKVEITATAVEMAVKPKEWKSRRALK